MHYKCIICQIRISNQLIVTDSVQRSLYRFDTRAAKVKRGIYTHHISKSIYVEWQYLETAIAIICINLWILLVIGVVSNWM